LKFLINTNLFISLAALAFTMESQLQLGLQPSFHPYLFIIFFATLFEYNLHRLITLAYHPAALQSPKHSWLRENKKAFYILVILSVTGFIISIIFAKKEVLFALFPLALLTLFYTLPIYRLKQRLLRLREIPGLKIFLISFIWAAVTVLLPIIQSGLGFDTVHVMLMITERFFFIFAITVPFDIRDMDVDRVAGLRTIPVMYGEKTSVRIANIAVLIFMAVYSLHYALFGMQSFIPAGILSGLLTLVSLNSLKLRQSSVYHYGILDGAILVQAILVGLFYFMSATA
jgi:4-hydroxybenzoate polyprenyltransferase